MAQDEDAVVCVLCGEPIESDEPTLTITHEQPVHESCYLREIDPGGSSGTK